MKLANRVAPNIAINVFRHIEVACFFRPPSEVSLKSEARPRTYNRLSSRSKNFDKSGMLYIFILVVALSSECALKAFIDKMPWYRRNFFPLFKITFILKSLNNFKVLSFYCYKLCNFDRRYLFDR